MFSYKLIPADVWYLEMHSPPDFLLPKKPDTEIELLPRPVSAEDYRKYYYGVGEKWNWLDRMVMPDEELLQKINRQDTEIFIFKYCGADAGYCELIASNSAAEIQYFGLFPEFIGRGLGKYFLQWTILKAWSYPAAKKIQLNTCSLDHPDALSIYKGCGFTEIRKGKEKRKIRV